MLDRKESNKNFRLQKIYYEKVPLSKAHTKTEIDKVLNKSYNAIHQYFVLNFILLENFYM